MTAPCVLARTTFSAALSEKHKGVTNGIVTPVTPGKFVTVSLLQRYTAVTKFVTPEKP